MARLFGNWSRLEVPAVIRFLRAKNVSASAMSRNDVAKVCHFFQSDRRDVENRNVTGSGWPISSTTEITTAGNGEIIQNE
ncbi:hypothetical protein TNCV_910881 [Trichonephila clavipes]|uniref:Uncharacterized protein n=1 Tax=Trichonephila clavipes TaxID=2585209 RepID=A0A8X6W3J0_TRICX|nr:hypothetical protein TNCV_910881 [Trichonephila clavipes]